MTTDTAPAPAPTFEQTDTSNERPASTVRILIVVEGTNDVEFLRRISRVLNADDPAVPDLAAMEHDRDVIFLPISGSDHRIWSRRLAPLGIPEFLLYDRDLPPRTQGHVAAVQEVNRRQGCIAAMTTFRHLENYLHPQELDQIERQKDELEKRERRIQRAMLAHVRGVPAEEVDDYQSYRYDHEIGNAVQLRRAVHEEELLAESERGRKILELRREKEDLLDTVWLACSIKQVKDLWQRLAEVLNDQPTPLQRDALSIEPIDND